MKHSTKLISLILALTVMILSACGAVDGSDLAEDEGRHQTQSTITQLPQSQEPTQDQPEPEDTSSNVEGENASSDPDSTKDVPNQDTAEQECKTFSISDVPAYSGKAFVVINNHQPYFTAEEITDIAFEKYSSLDELGRCGVAFACVGIEIMPTEERGSIGMVKPSGWHTVRYDGVVDGNYLYNRCHLIGYQLTGENANTMNLITGTRYLNIEGMLPFENLIAEYVEDTGNHVLYRVTPIFDGNNLVATGVLMEGLSVEDGGADVCFCVFAYNVQPGIVIDYGTGESYLEDGTSTEPNQEDSVDKSDTEQGNTTDDEQATSDSDYILNTNTKKFHYPSCSSVDDMNEKNKQEYTGSREDLISKGYSPCGRCKP